MADERGSHVRAFGSGGFYKDGKRIAGTGPERLEDLSSADDEADAEEPFDQEFWGPGYATAEQAALSGYPPTEARVVGVFEDAGDRVTLHVEVNRDLSYVVYEHCERHNGRWYDVGHTG